MCAFSWRGEGEIDHHTILVWLNVSICYVLRALNLSVRLIVYSLVLFIRPCHTMFCLSYQFIMKRKTIRLLHSHYHPATHTFSRCKMSMKRKIKIFVTFCMQTKRPKPKVCERYRPQVTIEHSFVHYFLAFARAKAYMNFK